MVEELADLLADEREEGRGLPLRGAVYIDAVELGFLGVGSEENGFPKGADSVLNLYQESHRDDGDDLDLDGGELSSTGGLEAFDERKGNYYGSIEQEWVDEQDRSSITHSDGEDGSTRDISIDNVVADRVIEWVQNVVRQIPRNSTA